MTKEKAKAAAKQIVDLVWLAARDNYSTVSSCEERAQDIILSVCNKEEGKPFGYNCAVCGEPIDDSQATDHTDEGLAHEECLSETPTPQGQVSEETGNAKKFIEFLNAAICPECDGSGHVQVPLGENFVSHEMGIDAGDRSMEGQSMGVEYKDQQCQFCAERAALVSSFTQALTGTSVSSPKSAVSTDGGGKPKDLGER